MICTSYQILFGLRYQIKKNEMGEAFITYWERRGACRGLVRKPEGKRPHGRLGMDGRIILKWMFKKGDEGMDWVDLAQDGDTW